MTGVQTCALPISMICLSPSVIARDGSSGVDASLKMRSTPPAAKTKSVNVPPVSTPTRSLRFWVCGVRFTGFTTRADAVVFDRKQPNIDTDHIVDKKSKATYISEARRISVKKTKNPESPFKIRRATSAMGSL